MRFEHFKLVRPCTGETLSGDVAVTKTPEHRLLAAIIDVSGHGAEANELARTLEDNVLNWTDTDLVKLLNHLHGVSRGTRGAAVGLALFDEASESVRYVGVGNTCIRKYGGKSWKGVSRDGVLGSRMRNLREETVDLAEGDVVAMYTDGLKERIGEDDYPRLTLETPASIGNTLIKKFGKSYDDASCIVIKCRA